MNVRGRVLFTAVVAALAIALVAGPAGATGWHFGTLDGASTSGGRVNGDVGQFTSTVMYAGTPHAFYRDSQHGTLRHAWWTGSKWAFETLDGDNPATNVSHTGGDVGTDVKAVIFAGQPHVFYYDVTNGDLRHAWWTGARWAFETLDGAAGGISGQSADTGTDLSLLSYAAGPHLFYYDVTNHALRHAWWTGAQWGFQTLDGTAQSESHGTHDVGQYTSAVIYGAGPQVFYYDDTAGVLRHTWWTGAQWGFETLDGLGGKAGQVNRSVGSDTAATIYGGSPHVWYYDIDNGDLRHAWWTGSAWGYETLDGAGSTNVGTYDVVTVFGGAPHVFYRDETNKNLRHAWWTGSAWAMETLDGSGSAGQSLTDGDVGLDSSSVNYLGQLQVLYYDSAGGNLRQAWYG